MSRVRYEVLCAGRLLRVVPQIEVTTMGELAAGGQSFVDGRPYYMADQQRIENDVAEAMIAKFNSDVVDVRIVEADECTHCRVHPDAWQAHIHDDLVIGQRIDGAAHNAGLHFVSRARLDALAAQWDARAGQLRAGDNTDATAMASAAARCAAELRNLIEPRDGVMFA